jgi:histidinol phosphatase-like enzyme (inositol monophosphatase family)
MAASSWNSQDQKHAGSAKDWLLQEVFPLLRMEILALWSQKGISHTAKPDLSPVTAADHRAEEIFRELSKKKFGEFGVLGEEFGEDRTDAPWVWTVDPIDGTRGFTRGLPFWGTQIGLLFHGEPVLGAVDYPALGKTVWAVKGMGAWDAAANQRLRLRKESSWKNAVVLHGGLSHYSSNVREKICGLLGQCFLERAFGDCAGYWYLLNGQVDLVLDIDLKPWDCVPFFPLIEEAGGIYVTLSGQREWKNSAKFVAGPTSLVQDLVRACS